MRRTVATTLLALACAASLAACARTNPGGGGAAGEGVGVDALARELQAFTGELAAKAEAGPDARAGVAEAQRLLDARKGEMAARIAALKKSPQMQDAAARGRWLEAEVDNTQRVHDLRVKHLDASVRDPGLKAALERLVADYDSMFADR